MRPRGIADAGRVGAQLDRQEAEEPAPPRIVEARVTIEQLTRDGNARRFPAPRDERAGELLDILLGSGAEQGPWQRGAALLGNRGQQLLKKGDVRDAVPFCVVEDNLAQQQSVRTAAQRYTSKPLVPSSPQGASDRATAL